MPTTSLRIASETPGRELLHSSAPYKFVSVPVLQYIHARLERAVRAPNNLYTATHHELQNTHGLPTCNSVIRLRGPLGLKPLLTSCSARGSPGEAYVVLPPPRPPPIPTTSPSECPPSIESGLLPSREIRRARNGQEKSVCRGKRNVRQLVAVSFDSAAAHTVERARESYIF